LTIKIDIVGAGVVGLCTAREFLRRGCQVRVISLSREPDEQLCSWWAGGMLAPHCEMESAEPLIGELGFQSMTFWRAYTEPSCNAGTLVVAPARDLAELNRFARLTASWQSLSGAEIEVLEPELSARFKRALYFADECHIEPRRALRALYDEIEPEVQWLQTDISNVAASTADWQVDCRGLSAMDKLPELRGVKGEMLIVKAPDVIINRPVRLLHPRIPLYIVPRADHQFMIGATMLENNERTRASVRSVLELLSAAVVLHPSFGEAEILEMGVDARPAFPDNLPRIHRVGRTLFINGMFRHGFLLAPAMAQRAADFVLDGLDSADVIHRDTSVTGV
jgi:glycine oxidase